MTTETRPATTYHCEACGADTSSPAMHENNRHDGAQTCWPVAESTRGTKVTGGDR